VLLLLLLVHSLLLLVHSLLLVVLRQPCHQLVVLPCCLLPGLRPA
jgi:hypothetical protein